MTLPTVIVYGFGPLGELPDLSPFVSKVAAYLSYQQWPFEIRRGNIRKAPRGKMPFAEVNGKRITDSDQIITELEKLHPNPLALDRSHHAIGVGRAAQSMIEHHLYYLAVYDRWNGTNWQLIKPEISAYLTHLGIPRILAGVIAEQVRKEVLKSTHSQGVGRLSDEERIESLKKILNSLESLLIDKPYLGGDQLERVDFIAFSMLRGCSCALFNSPLADEIRQRYILMSYLTRLAEVLAPPAIL